MARTLFRSILFWLGLVLFMLSSIVLFQQIKHILEDGLVGDIYGEASDSKLQLAVIEHGFITLIVIGLVIISLLIMSFYKDWDKEELKS
jgi:hypothetical protein